MCRFELLMAKPKNKELLHLRSLTEQNDSKEIKAYLENLPKNIKGDVFEDYLKLIFEHNGWLVKQTGKKGDAGADLLIYMEGNANPDFIIQAKNWKKPLDESDVGSELRKFEKKSSKKYSCKQYQLFSINGYTKSALKFSNYNIKLRDWWDIEALIDKFETTKPEIPAIELYSHNARAFDSINDMFEYENRVCVSHATGTGKSYLIGSVLQTYQDRNTIIAAPTNIILNELKEKFFYLMTNARLMTYSKLANIQKVDVGLVILDEFHRAGAVKWGAGVKRIMKANPDSIIFGTSATPYRYFEGRDMSDEIFEGNIASDLSLPKAIAKEILPSPKYVYGIYDINEESERVIENIENAKKLTRRQKNDYKTLLNKHKVDFERSGGMPEILRKHIKSNDRKFIIFCDDTSHLNMMELDVQKWFRKAFPRQGTEKYVVHSKISDNDKELDRFKKASGKKFHLLFSIDMLNEGLHVDGINGVVMLRRTASPRIFYQQIGRCIASGGYESPIIFDFVNNFNSIMATNFLSVVTGAVKSEQERRERDGLSSIYIPVDVTDETKDIEEIFFKIESKITEWLPFEDARIFTMSLNLISVGEWNEYSKSGKRPQDIPANPDKVYIDDWISFPDWLGYKRIADQDKKRFFIDAKQFKYLWKVLEITGIKDWQIFYKEIKLSEQEILFPYEPIYFYDEFKELGDLTGNFTKNIFSYAELKEYLKDFNIKSSPELKKWRNGELQNMPECDNRVPRGIANRHYNRKGTWISSYDLFGVKSNKYDSKGRYQKKYKLKLNQAKILLEPIIDKYDITEFKDYLELYDKGIIDNEKFPKHICNFYSCSVRDIFLPKWMSYDDAKKLVHPLKLKSIHQYREYWKSNEKPKRLPVEPKPIYQKTGTWIDWSDFLGKFPRYFRKWKTFKEAKKFAKKLQLPSVNQWKQYWRTNKKPYDVPMYPDRVYSKYWNGWADFLGYELKNKKK